MSITTLLDKNNAPLNRLSLQRLQLDCSQPNLPRGTFGAEHLIYLLVGSVSISVDGVFLGTFAGRRTCLESTIQAVRIPGDGAQHEYTIALNGHAADVLIVADHEKVFGEKQQPSYVHYADATCHDVGAGCYRREVREVPTPLGYQIHCGETVSDGREGVWSSFPAHATEADLVRYAEWEELFFVVTNGKGLIALDGTYCTGEKVNTVRVINNGDAFATPLGAHPIVFWPNTFGYYFWAYIGGHVLQKTYNKWATDVGTYVK